MRSTPAFVPIASDDAVPDGMYGRGLPQGAPPNFAHPNGEGLIGQARYLLDPTYDASGTQADHEANLARYYDHRWASDPGQLNPAQPGSDMQRGLSSLGTAAFHLAAMPVEATYHGVNAIANGASDTDPGVINNAIMAALPSPAMGLIHDVPGIEAAMGVNAPARGLLGDATGPNLLAANSQKAAPLGLLGNSSQPSQAAAELELMSLAKPVDVAEARVGRMRAAAAAVLDMSPEAKLARAKEMGFDTDNTWWHGSPYNDLETIKPGMDDPGAWFTTDLMNASQYAQGSDARMYDTHLRPGRSFVVTQRDGANRFEPHHNGAPLDPEYFIDNNDIVKHAFRNGYDSVRFPDGNFSESGDTMVMKNAHDIRLKDASFDPAKKDSSDLMAANPKVTALLAALAARRDNR
jgi:hypothetical protein